MKKKKIFQLIPFVMISVILSACGTSSTKETDLTASNPPESTTISEETKATENTESGSSESESSAETTRATENETQSQQSETQTPQTDQQLSRINYYDADGKLIYYDSYAYYDNGLLCSTTLHSVDYYDNNSEAQDSYTGNEYTFLYLYDSDGNIKTTMFGSLTIADNYDDATGKFVLDYDYDEEGNSTPIVIYPKEESIEQEKFHVDPSKTEKVYGEAPVVPTHAENGWFSSYLNEIFSQEAPTDMTEVRFLDVNDDGQPELWLDYGYGYAGGEVFTTDGSTTDKVYLSHGAAYMIKGSNLLHAVGGHMGGYYDEIYKIENGKFVTVAKGSYGETEDQQTDENGEPVYDYYWNDDSVTKEQYEQNLKGLFDQDQAEDIYQNVYTFEQCRTLLQEITDLSK